MKRKIIFAFVTMLSITSGYAQKHIKSKCKLAHDKELNVDFCKNADCSEGIFDNDSTSSIYTSKEFRFRNISKTYPEGQRVNFAYLLGADGRAIFIKVLEPKNDKEIEEEAKRLVSLIPLHKPCKCNGEAVAALSKITMPLISKKKE